MPASPPTHGVIQPLNIFYAPPFVNQSGGYTCYLLVLLLYFADYQAVEHFFGSVVACLVIFSPSVTPC